MKVWLGKETQTKLAAAGLSIPMVKGTAEAIQSPFYKALAVEVDHSGWICVAMDQLLGREPGRIFNDEALAVAAGAQSPQRATQRLTVLNQTAKGAGVPQRNDASCGGRANQRSRGIVPVWPARHLFSSFQSACLDRNQGQAGIMIDGSLFLGLLTRGDRARWRGACAVPV